MSKNEKGEKSGKFEKERHGRHGGGDRREKRGHSEKYEAPEMAEEESDFVPPVYRGRRLRSSAGMRAMLRQTRLDPAGLVMPYFVVETEDNDFAKPIGSMPGQYQLSPAMLEKRLEKSVDAGLNAILLFGIPQKKDARGSEAWNPKGIVQQAVRRIKKRWPDLLVITDVCLCEYTSHGHCGLLTPEGLVLNDETLPLLARTARSHAEAGADIVAPSDMMDGRILALRQELDLNGFANTPIMSYSVKYAGAFYGPFREAAESAPKSGDRKAYQMDPANITDAMRECAADIDEGADMLMVKPAGPYLDIIRMVADSFDLPLAAYQVSGEYSMIRAAAQNGWINEEAVILESLLGIKRAGADIIISYFAEELLLKGLVK